MKKILCFFIAIFTLFTTYNSYSQLIWSTFLGGSSTEYPTGFRVDNDSNSFVSGYTYSDEIPGNPGDYGYVVKLNALGIPLLKKRMPAVISPIPIVGGGYMALCLVKQLGTYDYYDISLVKIGPF